MNVPPTSELLAEYPVKYYIDGNQSWKNTTTLNWGQIFKGKHDVAALVGYEEFRKWARTTDISKKGKHYRVFISFCLWSCYLYV